MMPTFCHAPSGEEQAYFVVLQNITMSIKLVQGSLARGQARVPLHEDYKIVIS